MDKLIDLLVKIVQALFSPKTIWLIIMAVAIFTLALLLINGTSGPVIGIFALASIALILAKVIIWLVGLLKDQFFA